MQRLAWIALCALVSNGCYLAHERIDDGPVANDAGRADAGRRDSGSRPDRTPIDLPDAGADVSCSGTWIPTMPVRVTERPGDEALLDAEWVGAGFLMAWMSTNPDRDRTRFARLVSLDGTLGDIHAIFDPPAPVSGGMGIAVARHGIGATAWDERGCAFRSILALDGSRVGPLVRFPTPRVVRCDGLIGDSVGYSFVGRPLDSSSGQLDRLAPDGTLVSGATLDVFEGDVFWWSRAVLGDDALLFATMRGGASPTDALAQRVDRTGAPVTPPMPLPPFRGATRIGAIATPMGALMGWLENADGDGAQQAQQIRLFTTAPDGVPLTEPRPLDGLVAYRDAGWSMVRIGDVIFVVFVQPEMGDRYGDHTRLIAQRVTLEGTAIGDPIELASGRFLRRVVARTDGIHLLVGYVENAGESTELSFVTLECQAP